MNAMETRVHKAISNFSEAAIKHYDAQISGDWRTANAQAKKIHKSFKEILNLGEDARRALLGLTDTEALPVAAMAATYSIKYNPDKALTVLQKIAKEPGFIGFEAEQAIKRWTEGSWQLE